MNFNSDPQGEGPNHQVTIHTHASGEGGIFANSYLVETSGGAVAVDAPLTVSEARAFRTRLDSLKKPLLAVLITHPHPDHVAGITQLVEGFDAQVIALASVDRLMRELEEPKRAQWGPVFGDEWVQKWTYPNQLVSDRQAVTFDGLDYRVHDMGAGGDCDANSVWVLETGRRAAFVGDLVFNGTHSYVADGHVQDWLDNLKKAKSLLSGVETIYPGHGESGSLDLLDAQIDYLLAYRAAVEELAAGRPSLDDAAKAELVRRMDDVLPGGGLSFLVQHSADAVARELALPDWIGA